MKTIISIATIVLLYATCDGHVAGTPLKALDDFQLALKRSPRDLLDSDGISATLEESSELVDPILNRNENTLGELNEPSVDGLHSTRWDWERADRRNDYDNEHDLRYRHPTSGRVKESLVRMIEEPMIFMEWLVRMSINTMQYVLNSLARPVLTIFRTLANGTETLVRELTGQGPVIYQDGNGVVVKRATSDDALANYLILFKNMFRIMMDSADLASPISDAGIIPNEWVNTLRLIMQMLKLLSN